MIDRFAYKTPNVSFEMFFDRGKVQRAVDRANKRNLSKAGAFIRTRARQSIRKRKSVSAPGRPPTNRTGMLKKFILFGYDQAAQTVVIGPKKLDHVVGDDVPSVLEFGGAAVVSTGPRHKRKKNRVRIMARPYMGPAMVKELPNFPKLWKNTVK